MLKFLNKSFPFFLNEEGKNTILVLATSVFVTFFLMVYAPFEEAENKLLKDLMWGILCFVILYFQIVLLPKWFPGLFNIEEWTIAKYIVFNVWLLVSVSLIFSVLNAVFYCNTMCYHEVLLKTLKEVTLTGIIPLIIVTVFSKNELLRRNLADAVQANKKLNEIDSIREKAIQPDNTITLSTDTSETFVMKLTELVYVAAVDNYSEVYCFRNNAMLKKLLRVTLKNIEVQLKNQFIIRCHRSYLINIREIESISGNTNGYKLKMKNTDVTIPVSRSKGREIIAHIQQIRDMMEFL
jgi:DNA-binding LytR/AlgR family response regulator